MFKHRLFSICLVLLLFTSLVLSSEDKWSFSDVIKGEWDVDVTVSNHENSEVLNERGKYYVNDGVLEGVLIGNYTILSASPASDENAELEPVDLRIDLESGNQGSFKILKSQNLDDASNFYEESNSEEPLTDFSYKFEPVDSFAGVYISQGPYKAIESKDAPSTGVYQFVITDGKQFVLTYLENVSVDKETGKQQYTMKRIVGRKVSNQNVGFLARFGPTLMIVAVFIMSKYFTRQLAPQAAGIQRRAQRPSTGVNPNPENTADSSSSSEPSNNATTHDKTE